MNKYNKADRVLLITFVLFICAWLLKHFYSDNFMTKAFFVSMEAALVGGIADWFAVTALFTRPLGFPWHTALIPTNRENLIEATANMVQFEFFSKERLQERVQNIHFVDLLISFVENQNGKQAIALMIAGYIGQTLRDLDARKVASLIEKQIKNNSNQIMLVPLVQGLANWLLNNRKDEQFLNYILTQVAEMVQRTSTRQKIYEYLQQYKEKKTSGFWKSILGWVGEKTNSININDATDSFHEELKELIEELSRPSHPLRVLFHQRLENIAELSNNPDWCEKIENWKEGVIERVTFQEQLVQIVKILIEEAQIPKEELENLLKDYGFMGQKGIPQSISGESFLVVWYLSTIDKYWEVFRQDPEIQELVEGYLQKVIQHIIDSEHDIIKVMVKDAMQVLSAEELNRLIESRIGEDLQYIRINGSIVGGIAGLAIFLIIQATQSDSFLQLFR